MNSRILLSVTAAAISFILASACTTPKSKKKSPQEMASEAARPVIGSFFTTLVFEKGQSALTSKNKSEIKKLTAEAEQKRIPIEEIRILAWADQEYPEHIGKKPETQEIILASERARNIREYLEKELPGEHDIDSYNMARRPGLLSKLLKNEEYQIKETIEKSGTTGTTLPDGSVSYSKASKVLIVIDY